MANNKLLPRGYTEADWLGAQGDPVLAERELAFVTDTGEHVLGDGATAFSGLTRYGGENGAFRADDRPIVLGAADLAAVDGSPTLTGVGVRWPAWALDDSATAERIGGVADMPPSWTTFNVDIWHTTATGNAGNVVYDLRLRKAPTAGDGLASDDVHVNNAEFAAVDTASELGIETVLSGQAVTEGLNFIALERFGSSASDTLTGDLLVIAIVLRKAS